MTADRQAELNDYFARLARLAATAGGNTMNQTEEQLDAAEDQEQLQRRFDAAMQTLSDALDGSQGVYEAAQQAVE